MVEKICLHSKRELEIVYCIPISLRKKFNIKVFIFHDKNLEEEVEYQEAWLR